MFSPFLAPIVAARVVSGPGKGIVADSRTRKPTPERIDRMYVQISNTILYVYRLQCDGLGCVHKVQVGRSRQHADLRRVPIEQLQPLQAPGVELVVNIL